MVWKADGVAIENLTVCNFLAGSASSGNEIWWNGGDGSGKIGLGGYDGSYLTATTTFFGERGDRLRSTASSRRTPRGPGVWTTPTRATSTTPAMYVGACLQVCNIDDRPTPGSEYSALGYSGTNSGGAIVVKNSEFDNNQDGFDTNSQNNGDPPSPQNGACPKAAIGPITHTHSCWVFMHNNVHDNNNPNVPRPGARARARRAPG